MEATNTFRTDSEIRDKIREVGERYFVMAEGIFGKTIKRPDYLFDIRGVTAGMACFGPWTMRFNMHISRTHFDDYMARTVPHEVAHMVEKAVYGTSGHKAPWKRIMRRFGCEPSRCHSYDDLRTASGKTRPKITCRCGEREIGPIVYKRVVKGVIYRCKTCKQAVKPLAGVSVAPSVTPTATREPKPSVHNATCGCGTCKVGPTQLKRLIRGQANYRCRKCGTRVKPL
jgi:SprT protein